MAWHPFSRLGHDCVGKMDDVQGSLRVRSKFVCDISAAHYGRSKAIDYRYQSNTAGVKTIEYRFYSGCLR